MIFDRLFADEEFHAFNNGFVVGNCLRINCTDIFFKCLNTYLPFFDASSFGNNDKRLSLSLVELIL